MDLEILPGIQGPVGPDRETRGAQEAGELEDVRAQLPPDGTAADRLAHRVP